MDLNIKAAQDELENPSEAVLNTIAGASQEAKDAIASIAPQGSSLASMHQDSSNNTMNASHSQLADVVATGVNGTLQEDTARLQVVDEV